MSRQTKVKYDKAALENAVRAVNSKSMGYLKASKVFNVPRSTIFDKVNGKSDIETRKGPHTILYELEESRLVKWLLDMSKIGYGRSKFELLETVKKIVDSDGRKTPFKDGRPGKDWYYGFIKRHPELSLRSPRQLGKERAVIQPSRVEQWFQDFEHHIESTTGDKRIFQDPSRIYNADESGFSMCPNTGRVIGLHGAKSVHNMTASDKSQITVMAGMSASAHFLRPMIVFPGQRFTRNMLEGFEEAVLGRSENGWMDSDLFTNWLTTVFIPDINERQVKRPVILLVDGHRTHMTLEASDICRDNEIILYCLLEHASHLMQPCDLRLFAALKESWKIALREWQIDHIGQYVTKFEFAGIFRKAWVKAARIEIAVGGFKEAGIFPIDMSAVLKTDKMQTSKLFSPKAIDSTVKSQTETSASDVSNEEQNSKEKQESKSYVNNQDDTENARNDPVLPTVGEKNQSPLSKILKVPEPAHSKKSKNVKREILPKAITGSEFRSLLIERKRKREEEEAAKAQRKQERIQKREEKERAKHVRAEERVKKQKQKQDEKERKQKLQGIKKKIQALKKKKRGDDDSDSESDFSLHDETDDEADVGTSKCYKCGEADDKTGWIACQRCLRFFHRVCTDIDLEHLTEEEIAAFPFKCLFC